MSIICEAQAESGKYEAKEEKAAERDGGEAKLTSGRVQASEDDGQDQRVTGSMIRLSMRGTLKARSRVDAYPV